MKNTDVRKFDEPFHNKAWLHYIGSQYSYPKYNNVVFDYEYVLDELARLNEKKMLSQLARRIEDSSSLSPDIVRKIIQKFSSVLNRSYLDVIMLDSEFVNQKTIGLWKENFSSYPTTFVYIEVGKSEDTETRFQMMDNKMLVIQAIDTDSVAQFVHRKLSKVFK